MKPPAAPVPAPSVTLESLSGANDPLMEAAYLRAQLARPAPPPRETGWTAAQHKLVMKLVLYLRAGDCETCGAAKSCALCVELNEQLDAVNAALKALTEQRAELARLQQALQAIVDDYEAMLGDGLTDANQPNVLRNARAAMAPSPAPRGSAPPQWQEIATHDKTPDVDVLVWMHDDAPHRAWLGDLQSGIAIARWTTHNGGGWVSYRPGTPTHWMPLPEPPPASPATEAPR